MEILSLASNYYFILLPVVNKERLPICKSNKNVGNYKKFVSFPMNEASVILKLCQAKN